MPTPPNFLAKPYGRATEEGKGVEENLEDNSRTLAIKGFIELTDSPSASLPWHDLIRSQTLGRNDLKKL
jgi:hypothetical protein